MSGSNQFRAIATGGGANALTPAAYAALVTSTLGLGYSSGVANSTYINTTLRQSSFVVTAIAQAIADMSGAAVNDDGVIANFENQFLAMLQQAPYCSGVAAGTADAITLVLAPALTALTNGQTVIVRAGFANATTTPTFSPNGLTAKTIVKGAGSALAAGDIAGAGHWIELQYDTTLAQWVLQNPATGISVSSGQTIQGGFKNLQASANGTTAAVNVSADELVVENAAHAYLTLRSLSLSANTAAASGAANSLDTGAWAFSTWYYVFVIYNSTTAALLFSLSATAPTLPSGYTYFARVGAIRTQSATNYYPLAFKQYGRRVQYVATAASNVPNLPVMATGALGNVSTPTWSAVAIGVYVPPTASQITCLLDMPAANAAMLAPNNAYGAFNSTTNPPINAGNNTSVVASLNIETMNIYYASSGAGLVACLGWEDNL